MLKKSFTETNRISTELVWKESAGKRKVTIVSNDNRVGCDSELEERQWYVFA